MSTHLERQRPYKFIAGSVSINISRDTLWIWFWPCFVLYLLKSICNVLSNYSEVRGMGTKLFRALPQGFNDSSAENQYFCLERIFSIDTTLLLVEGELPVQICARNNVLFAGHIVGEKQLHLYTEYIYLPSNITYRCPPPILFTYFYSFLLACAFHLHELEVSLLNIYLTYCYMKF